MRAVDALNLKPPLGPAAGTADLLAEANHRIANNLTLLVSAVKAQAMEVAARNRLMRPSEVVGLLDEVGSRLNTVGVLHRLLSTAPGGSSVEIGGFLRRVGSTVIAALAAEEKIDLTWTGGGVCDVPAEQVLPIALIVAEVLTNAVKYAHPTGMAVKAWAGCVRRSDGAILVDISDDGVGLPEGFDPESDGGLGYRTLRSLAGQIGAQLLFRSGPLGLGVTLVIPAPPGAHRVLMELVS